MSDLGIVAIGRNEGERLRRCLNSLMGYGLPVVYVDSNSTDGSVELARSMGAEVVELDVSVPFTAARARNAGFERLLQLDQQVRFVQFVDGDCEVVAGWLDRARLVLEDRPDVAVVFGRRRERNRDQTVYNRLADLEWDAPVGEVKACGGDAVILVEAFQCVGGYNPSIIAAEDDELCLRIRGQGWRVLRIDADMTLHDMEMTRFKQWWRRAVRCGHAYAEGVARHGRTDERHFVRQFRSALFWGLLLPLLVVVGLILPMRGASLALLIGYAYLFWKTERYYRLHRRWSAADARLYAIYCVIAKFPHVVGIATYLWRRIRRKPTQIIEYRTTAVAATAAHATLDPERI